MESHGTFSFLETIDTHQARYTFARVSVTNSRQKIFRLPWQKSVSGCGSQDLLWGAPASVTSSLAILGIP